MANVKALFGAGTDTTKAAITWLLMSVAQNKDVQEKCRSEIFNVIGKDRLPSTDDKRLLPYVQAVILESMRWKILAPLNVPRR